MKEKILNIIDYMRRLGIDPIICDKVRNNYKLREAILYKIRRDLTRTSTKDLIYGVLAKLSPATLKNIKK